MSPTTWAAGSQPPLQPNLPATDDAGRAVPAAALSQLQQCAAVPPRAPASASAVPSQPAAEPGTPPRRGDPSGTAAAASFRPPALSPTPDAPSGPSRFNLSPSMSPSLERLSVGLGSRGGSGNSLMAFNAGLMGLRSAGSASSSSSLAGPPPGAGPAEDAPDSLSLKLHVITFNMADMTPSRSVLQCPACHRSLRCMRPCLESSNNAAKVPPQLLCPIPSAVALNLGAGLSRSCLGRTATTRTSTPLGLKRRVQRQTGSSCLLSICLHPSMSRWGDGAYACIPECQGGGRQLRRDWYLTTELDRRGSVV